MNAGAPRPDPLFGHPVYEKASQLRSTVPLRVSRDVHGWRFFDSSSGLLPDSLFTFLSIVIV